MEKMDIKSLNLQELKAQMKSMGQPAFRAEQIFAWLHEARVTDFDAMTNLSKAFREELGKYFYINSFIIKKRLVSSLDGTIKYLYELRDGNCVEAVLMRYKYGYSLCISTQVGCRMGCRFCASTLGGLVRSLTPSEMLDEIYTAQADVGERISHVVLMGIGEPLDNYDNVLKFLELVSAPKGCGLSLRNVSLSTCGLAEEIDRLAERRLGLTLSISLHAPNDEIRSRIMPVNRRYPLARLMAACRNYFEVTGRRISFEYTLIEGVNDAPSQARELISLLKGLPCHVNLIPVNEVAERDYRRTGRRQVEAFRDLLIRGGINATVRRELGSDVSAACGQLRRETAKEEQSSD